LAVYVACSTILTSATQPHQTLVPPLIYTYQSPVALYILVHIITDSLCATNFIYKMQAQTSHLTRTSTCPAELHTATISSHSYFTFNTLSSFPSHPTAERNRKALVIRKHAVFKARLPSMQIFLEAEYNIHEINVRHDSLPHSQN
jgi:hypothetical protein